MTGAAVEALVNTPLPYPNVPGLASQRGSSAAPL